jgi:hypothetical protein
MADVVTSFSAKDVGFAATMQRLQSRLAGFNKQMNTVSSGSAAVATSFKGLTKSVVGLGAAYLGVSQAMSAFSQGLDLAGRMADMSTITGESAGNLAVLERAFNNTDIGGEKMLPMLSRMTEFIQKLGNNSPEAVAMAEKLGVSFERLKSQTPIEQFKTLIQAVAKLSTENEQLTATGDIFGNRMGAKMIPLATKFAEEMGKARAQLGDLVPILNTSAGALDDLGDAIKVAIASKPLEFAIGLLAAMTGKVDGLATSISNLNAAGAGMNIGKLLMGGMEAPEQAFVALGETLLKYAMMAGNVLIDSVTHAGVVWQKYLTDPSTQRNLMDGLILSIQSMLNWANKGFYKLFRETLNMLDSLTGGWWPNAKKSIADMDKLIGQFDNQTAEIQKNMRTAMGVGAEALLETARNTPRAELKTFDVAAQAAEADAAWAKVKTLGETATKAAEKTKPLADFFTELEAVYKKEAARIKSSGATAEEQEAALKKLGEQYNERRNQALYPPNKQMSDASMSDQQRRDAASAAATDNKLASAGGMATESTLEKAVRYLEELTTKLPAPVLV